MSHTGVWERYDWLRNAFIEEAGRRVGGQRAAMLYHAVDTVFSASFHELKPRVGATSTRPLTRFRSTKRSDR
jgi:hypothetical protein